MFPLEVGNTNEDAISWLRLFADCLAGFPLNIPMTSFTGSIKNTTIFPNMEELARVYPLDTILRFNL